MQPKGLENPRYIPVMACGTESTQAEKKGKEFSRDLKLILLSINIRCTSHLHPCHIQKEISHTVCFLCITLIFSLGSSRSWFSFRPFESHIALRRHCYSTSLKGRQRFVQEKMVPIVDQSV